MGKMAAWTLPSRAIRDLLEKAERSEECTPLKRTRY
jgi:hypothetical protein